MFGEAGTITGTDGRTVEVVRHACERILTRNMLGDTPVRVISLTPLLSDDATFACFRDWRGDALHVIGTADHHYIAGRVAQLDKVLVLDGVDHGFQVENDTVRSVQAMERIVAAMRGFLA